LEDETAGHIFLQQLLFGNQLQHHVAKDRGLKRLSRMHAVAFVDLLGDAVNALLMHQLQVISGKLLE
jgi:hypothetical protein